MPNPHFNLSIVGRSHDKSSSAVASAAYQAGDKLYSEYDMKMKNYQNKKTNY